ncbi:MAG: putative Ig domain-containing protein, partial [Synergistaceae bacterium]|nr:putative Ig domain-containing protein [Synergistaceae bacterium]
SLPDGLTLWNYTGEVSGTPNTAKSYEFTVQAYVYGVTVENTFDISVIKSDDKGDDKDDKGKEQAHAVILTNTLPSATVNTQYSQTLSYDVTPGYSVYWSKVSGDLPSGFTLSSDGTISGITETAGTYTFKVSLTAAGITVSKDFTLTVLTHSDAQPSVTITSTAIPDGKIGESYSTVLTSSPSGAYWVQSGGIIPPGLALNSDGALSGVPSVTGNFAFFVTASHSQYSPSTQEYEIQISARTNTQSSSGGGGGGCNSLAVRWLVLFAIILRKKVS